MTKGGPVVPLHGATGRDVGQGGDPSLVEGWLPDVWDRGPVGVGEDEGEDFIWVGVEESLYFLEVVNDKATVEEDLLMVESIDVTVNITPVELTQPLGVNEQSSWTEALKATY